VEKARKRPAGGRTWGSKRASSADGLGEKERLTAWKKKEDRTGVLEVILHLSLTGIRRGLTRWRATQAIVVNLYTFSLSYAKNVLATVKMLSGEAPPVIMVKS
jgi:hypothetical protein